ncbi:unnamed protein product [Microthlaspi erraticum]|uniref:Uncharacterized protein n=1 Tax=Microthlaspi erraticum TaxID=1685480 RepID=A0A6D2IPW5_9BRAS|nr:unnamed protein product [Microthlaspi erraticum]
MCCKLVQGNSMNLSHRLASPKLKTARLKVSSRDSIHSSAVDMPRCSGSVRRAAVIFLSAISITCFLLYRSADSLNTVSGSSSSIFSRILPSYDSFKSLVSVSQACTSRDFSFMWELPEFHL